MKKRIFRSFIANVLIIAMMLGQVAQVTAAEAITSESNVLTPTTTIDSIQNTGQENIQQQTEQQSAQTSKSATQVPTSTKPIEQNSNVGTQAVLSQEQLISAFNNLVSTDFNNMLISTPSAITTSPGEKIDVTLDGDTSVIINDIADETNNDTQNTTLDFETITTSGSITVTTPGAIKIVSLAAGERHSLQVKNDGTVWAWGYNNCGQLGDGTTTTRTVSTQVNGITDVVAVAAGQYSSYALKNDGTVWAWGYNYYGQLGDGTYQNSNKPMQVKNLSDVIAIASGKNHVIALRRNGTVWAWGSCEYGHLGNGINTNSNQPVQVQRLNDITDIAAGKYHNLALKSDGTVLAWGYNGDGQLGNGIISSTVIGIPVPVKELNDISDIEVGDEHSLALKNDGTVWAWGDNYYGQLGDKDIYVNRSCPIQVNNLNSVIAIASYSNYNLALRNDGTIWAWGYNGDGQLGDGTKTNRIEPVQVKNIYGITSIATGNSHSLAIDGDSEVWAWGDNYYGQLGDFTNVDRSVPIRSKKDVTAPTAPTNLSAIVKENCVVLNWLASLDEKQVLGYDIYLNGTKLATVSGTTYIDISDSLNKIREYKVIAFDDSGNYSQEACIELTDLEAPSAPVNLKVTSQIATTVSLEWEASTDNVLVEGYRIYRNGVFVGDSKETSFTDDVPRYTTYTYIVKAYDKFNLSEASNTASVIIGILKPHHVIAGGNEHSLQVNKDGAVWAWGNNNCGQLGDGTKTNRSEPVQVKDLTGITAVAAGYSHSIALKKDGTVWAWGYDGYGQLGIGLGDNCKTRPIKVRNLVGISAIAAGESHSLALNEDGTVWAWGRNYEGELGDGTYTQRNIPVQVIELSGVIAIASKYETSFALKRDGTVWAWGYNNNGELGDGSTTNSSKPLQVKNLSNVIAITSGGYHELALKSDGTVWAWGWNGTGQYGDGTTTTQYTPLQISGLSDIIAIEAGREHTVALKSDGTVWAWGSNQYGQLGNETTLDSYKPVQVKGLSNVEIITTGYCHNLAINASGTVYTWGGNWSGQIGDGTVTNRNIPVFLKDIYAPTVPTQLAAVIKESNVVLTWTASIDNDRVAGYEIYRDGVLLAKVEENTYTDVDDIQLDKIYVYTIKAYDGSGNLSDSASIMVNDTEAPSIPSNLKVTSKSNTMVCLEWETSTDNVGVEGYEIFRNGLKIGETKNTSYVDTTVNNNENYVYSVKAYDKSANISEESSSISVTTDSLKSIPLAAGGSHSLQVQQDGTVWAWGSNCNGQLGDGTTKNKTVSTQVKGITDVVAVACGSYHSMALKNDGTVWTWGYNGNGQLGDGTTNESSNPKQVKNLNDVVAIAAGDYHSIVLKSDGTVWAWGYNCYGQLGDGSTKNSSNPIQVKNLSDVIAITAGEYHNLALKSDGTVLAWGYNSYGQLGDGTNSNQYFPNKVQYLENVINLAAGYNHSLAIKNDGTVWAWGDNGNGQLGDDGINYRSSFPIQVTKLDDIIAIDSNNNYSLALRNDGTIWAWGDNWQGQLGDGTTTNKKSPIQVTALSKAIAIAAGGSHSLALVNDREIWAWGYNGLGQLGDGTKINRNTPIISKDITKPTIPTNLTATIEENSAVLTWTASTDGDCISGYEIYRNDVKLAKVTETTYRDNDIELDTVYVYKVYALDGSGNMSEEESVVINDIEAPLASVNLKLISKTATTVSLEWEASNDNVWVEGYEIYRDGVKVGNSTDTRYTDIKLPHNSTYIYMVKAYDKSNNTSKESNTQSVTTDTIKSIPLAAGDNHSLQVQKDRTVWAWGYNYSGQLGNGTTINKFVPVPVKGIQDVIAVAAGQSHSLALKNDGTVWAWGYNGYCQLGDGTTSNKLLPVQVNGLYDVVSIATKGSHSVALKSDGTVWTWGNNGNGQLGNGTYTTSFVPVQVLELNDVIEISAGYSHNLALKSDGTVWAWGYNGNGQIGIDTTANQNIPVQVKDLNNAIAIAAGNFHSVALKSDGIICAWGYEQFVVKDLIDVTNIAAGGYYTVALKSNGTIWTWGNNTYGQLGDGTTTSRQLPMQINNLSDAIAIAAGSEHSLALKSDETVWAWGYNNSGQLGDGTRIRRCIPIISKDIIAPTIPTNLSIEIKENSVVLTWTASTDEGFIAGYEIYRDDVKLATVTDTTYIDNDIELDKIYVYKIKAVDSSGNMSEEESIVLNDTEAPSAPINLKILSNTATTVSLDWEAPNDNVWVDGYEIYRDGVVVGNSKDIKYTDSAVPHNATHTYMVKAYDKSNNKSEESNSVSVTTDALKSIPLAGGLTHTLYIQKDGTVLAWGCNDYGQLGDGTNTTKATSAKINGVVAVAAGIQHSMALRNDGTVWAWGDNSCGQLGDGTSTDRFLPVQVMELSGVSAISAGANYSLALKSDGTVWSWGFNYSGQLGDGTSTNRYLPVQVMELSGVSAISAGDSHSLALKNDGTVWTWGYNGYKQLGDGTYLNKYLPVQVNKLSDVSAISAGGRHSIALKSDGTVWAWGNNEYGQLGYETKWVWSDNEMDLIEVPERKLPVQVAELSGVSAISAGGFHNVVQKSDGTIWAWGYNEIGQLGDGTFVTNYKPVKVKDMSNVIAIEAGYNHCLALKSDGSVWAWGYNYAGQLGDGTTTNRNIPVSSLDLIAPSAPTNLASRSTDTTVSLTWTNSYDGSGVAGYNVYRDGEKISTVTQTEYKDTNLTFGKTYTYTVKAFDATGNISEASSPVINDMQMPTTPTDLSVIAKTLTSITLSWTASTDNVAVKGYEIYRDSLKIGTIDATNTSYTDKKLEPDTYYTYSINAFDTGFNYSLQSENLKETTYKDTTAPSSPKNLYIKDGMFTVGWDTATDDVFVQGYEVYRDGIKVGTTNATYYTDKGLKLGMTYVYTIRAYDSTGNISLESVPLTVSDDYGNTIETATAIQLGNDILGNINYQYDNDYLSFVAPVEGNYTITCSSNSKHYKNIYLYDDKGTVLISNNTYYSVDLKRNLSASKTYYIRINSEDISAYSVKVILSSDTEKPSAPTELSAISKTISTVTLGWTESTDNIAVSGYKIYRDDIEIVKSYYNSEMKYTDTYLESGKTYKYIVKAYDSAGNISEASNEVSVTTDTDTIAPTAPTELKITEKTAASISLTWKKSTDNTGVKGYYVLKDGEKIGTTDNITFTCAFTDLTTSNNYSVQAYDLFGNVSLESNVVFCDNTSPTIVKDIEVLSKTASKINLSWTESQDNVGVTSYQIYRGNSRVGTTTDTSFNDTALLPETEYIYTIRAIDAAGNVSEPSEDIKVKTDADINPPTTPLNVNILSYSATSVMLAWTAVTDDVKVAGYQVYRNGSKLGLPTNMTTFTDSDLDKDATYVYTVRAIDTSGNESEESKAVLLDRIAPSKPENLELISRGADVITISWTKSTDNLSVDGYEIYRNGEKIDTVPDNTYTNTGLQLNETYTYAVKAFDASKNMSEISESVEATTTLDTEAPSAPSDLKISARTGSTITIEWTASTDNTGVSKYEIYRDEVNIGVSTTNSFTDTGLTAGTAYSYTIRAVDASENISKASTPFNAVPLKPEILKVTPLDLDVIGGAVSQELRVYFSTSGVRTGTKAKFEYSIDDTSWTTITGLKSGPIVDDSSIQYFTCLWDLVPMNTGDYKIRYTVYDAAESIDTKTVTYEVDKDAPSAPKNLNAESMNGDVQLAWDYSTESDAAGYRIYRAESENERFIPVGETNKRELNAFNDKSVILGNTYYYKVTAIDKFRQESLFSNVIAVTVVEDNIVPTVISISPASGKVIGTSTTIAVKAKDNVSVSTIKIQYSIDKGQTWVDIASTKTTGMAEIIWNTPEINGEVLSRAIAIDKAGNESDGTPERKYIIDRTGPSKINGLTKTEYSNSVILRWDDVDDKDFAYFQVERKDTANGEFKSVGKVSDTLGLHVKDLSCESTYWFRVVAYDELGNRGTPSDEIKVVTLSDLVAPVITNIGPAPGYYNNKIGLSANVQDNVAVQSFTFQISSDMKVWNDIVTLQAEDSPEQATFKYSFDISEMEEGTYYIRGIAADKFGNTTNDSASVQYIIDHTSPKQPENIKATPSYIYNKLEWDRGSESDLRYYNVYRSTIENGTYALICKVSALGYMDNTVVTNTKYYYKVTAVDMAGNESVATEPVSCTLLDMLADTEKPKIITLSPALDSILPANPTIGILVQDNFKVDKVTLKYRADGDSADDWKLIGVSNVGRYSEIVRFTWNTAGLSDGNYIVQALAVDEAGNKSDAKEINYKLNVEAPAQPQVTAVPGDFKVDLSWTCGEESDLAGFLIYRSIVPNSISDYICLSQTRDKFYTDNEVKDKETYYYMVKALDNRGNYSWSNEVQADTTGSDLVLPVAVAGDEQTVILGMEVEFDGRGSHDNNRIASYEWDFGDGYTATVARTAHTYEKEGTYIVTLTAYDPAGNKATSTTNINVVSDDKACGLEIKVADESNGSPVADAKVLVQFTDGTVKEFNSNSLGLVKFAGAEGSYKLFAYKNNYSSVEGKALLQKGTTVKTTLSIKESEFIKGTLNVERMTLDEIVNAGIDVNAAENQWVYECNVVLGFRPYTMLVNSAGEILSCSSSDGGFGIGGGGGEFAIGSGGRICYPQAVASPQHPEVPPTIYYLVIPTKTSWLKEFFDVSLVLENMSEAGSAFAVTNSTAELNAPDGLTFIPSDYSRSTLVKIGDIEPGETKEIKWILRGDKKGDYELKAEFNGILQPFGEPITGNYTVNEKVWGDDALEMHINAEDIAFEGELYLAKVELENVSDEELYNVGFEVKEGETYTLAPGTTSSKTIEIIKAGEKMEFEIWLIPSFTGKLDLKELDIRKTGGNATINTTFGTIEAPKALLNVTTETSYKEIQDDYYFCDVIANISNLRDNAQNVKAELSWTGTDGIKDIQLLESNEQKLGDFTAGLEKQVIWRVKIKSDFNSVSSDSASLNYVVKVSGDNVRSKSANGSINVGGAKLGIALSYHENKLPSSEWNEKQYTIKANIYNYGGIAINGKAELKILSQENAEDVEILFGSKEDLGTFDECDAIWIINIKLKNQFDITKLCYQVTVSADNAESFTKESNIEDIHESDKLISGKFNYASGEERDYEADFYYNDSYFSTDSSKYNHNLGTMSICFAMSAFGSNCYPYYFKSNNAKTLLKKLEFDEFETNAYFKIKPTIDTIGALAAYKKVRCNGKEYTLIAVAVRGAGYEREWSGNFKIGDLGQHDGFSEAKDNVLAFLREYIRQKKISGDIKIWITGYSRAAATANLVAGAIDDGTFLGKAVTLKPSDLYAYTFGTPAGALLSEIQNKYKYNNIYNIINPSDPVPKVAPTAMGFCRYGNDYYLPSCLLKDGYSDLEDNMKNIFNKMDSTNIYIVEGNKDRYILDSFSMKKLDRVRMSPLYTQPIYKFKIIDDKKDKTPQSVFLDSLINDISKEVIKTRSNYVDNYQSGVCELFNVKYDDNFNNFLDIFITKIKTNLPLILYKFKNNISEYDMLIRTYIIQSQLEAGLEEYDIMTIGESLQNILSPLLEYGVTHQKEIFTTIDNLKIFGAAHFPSLYLSWMMSMDNNYTPFAEPVFTDGSYRKIKINCPVDVNVYNELGVLVAAIKSDEPQNIDGSSIISSINEDGEKIVYLPADADYKIEIIATDNGKVTYSVNEYNSSVGDVTRIINYFDVDIKKDDVLMGEIPAFSGIDFENVQGSGSSVEYSLKSTSNEEIAPDVELKGSDAADAYYMVYVSANNDKYGMVTGQGIRQLGGYAKVTATAYEGYKFSGWYVNDELISSDSEYRFCVTKDETLIAKFTTIDPTVVDSFEYYYGDNDALSSRWSIGIATGCAITPILTDSNKYDGNYGLAFNYSLVSSNGNVGITKEMDGADWSSKNAVQLWTKPDGKKQKVIVQLTSAGNVFEVYLNEYAEYLNTTGSAIVTIPFSCFVGRDDKTAVFDPTSIDSFGLWCNSILPEGENANTYKLDSVIYYDEIKTISSDVSSVTVKALISTIKPGDVNDDGAVDSIDYALLKMYLLDMPAEINTKNADLNQDGSIDSIDFAKLWMLLIT